MSGNRGRRRPFRKERGGQGQGEVRRPQDGREARAGGDWKPRREDRSQGRSGAEWRGGPNQDRPQGRSGGERRGGPNQERSRNRQGARPVRYDKNGVPYERLRWTAPALNTDPMPAPECARCGKPIADLHAALTDRNGGVVHFDCVMAELTERESLETGDALSYIGGGRFGIVRFDNPGRGEAGRFTIKKILEWEDKENRADWRGTVADHYSIT